MGESLDGCAQCAKILMIVFNLIFFLIGAAFLGVGIWTITDFYKPDILAIMDNPAVTNGAYILIAVGGFIFILAGLGCCGACCQNKCMLILYFIILLVVLIIQIAAFAVVLAFKGTVDSYLRSEMQDSMDRYQDIDATDTYSTAWNAAQIFLGCCGIDNYTDWQGTDWHSDQTPTPVGGTTVTLDYPLSCCYVEDPSNIINGDRPEPANTTACIGYNVAVPNEFMYDVGCYTSLKDFFMDNILYVGAVGLGIAFIEIMGLILSCCIYRALKKNEEVV
ncbi:tetraspanin-18-like isoform X2 [Ptychodera flava]|uniref:tetraspanin-18-like isoform X2 n=1 Tax=Ptychodera flava TaxID=63121 RepID=UPI003969F18A